MTFEELQHVIMRQENLGEGFGTTFWEDLYQLFKKRMNEEAEQEKQKKESV
jgi:hypothetical protein